MIMFAFCIQIMKIKEYSKLKNFLVSSQKDSEILVNYKFVLTVLYSVRFVSLLNTVDSIIFACLLFLRVSRVSCTSRK